VVEDDNPTHHPSLSWNSYVYSSKIISIECYHISSNTIGTKEFGRRKKQSQKILPSWMTNLMRRKKCITLYPSYTLKLSDYGSYFRYNKRKT
jgi:hypothetical protein